MIYPAITRNSKFRKYGFDPYRIRDAGAPNLRVDGVHEDEGETCEVTEAKVKQVLKEKLSLPNDPVIERARRIVKKLSSTAPRRPRIVVCRLRDCKERESLSKLARRIEPERVYIKEDLAQATIEKPEEQRAKFEEAERAGKIVYFVLGKLVMRDRPA